MTIWVLMNGNRILGHYRGDAQRPDRAPNQSWIELSQLKNTDVVDLQNADLPLAKRQLVRPGLIDPNETEPKTFSAEDAGSTALMLYYIDTEIAAGRLLPADQIRAALDDGTPRLMTVQRFQRIARNTALKVLTELQ